MTSTNMSVTVLKPEGLRTYTNLYSTQTTVSEPNATSKDSSQPDLNHNRTSSNLTCRSDITVLISRNLSAST